MPTSCRSNDQQSLCSVVANRAVPTLFDPCPGGPLGSDYRCTQAFSLTTLSRAKWGFSPPKPATEHAVTSSEPQEREQSTRSWDALRRSPSTSSRQTGPHSADRQRGSGTCQMAACTARISRSPRQAAPFCTSDRQTRPGAATLRNATTLEHVAVRPNNSSA